MPKLIMDPIKSMAIPAKILRKPFFLILEHLIKSPKCYTRYFSDTDHKLGKNFDDNLVEHKFIAEYPALSFGFADKEEAAWFEGSKGVSVTYENAYHVNKFKAHFCQAINIASRIGIPESQVITTKTSKGGQLQTELNAKLCEFDIVDDKMIFKASLINVSDEYTEKLFRYVKKILKDLYTDKKKIQAELLALDFLWLTLNEYVLKNAEEHPEQKETERIAERHKKFWRNQLPQVFEGTRWLCMERTDAVRSQSKSDFGIAISPVIFHSQGSELTCEMQNMYYAPTGKINLNRYSGIATVGEQKEYLHVELHRQHTHQERPGAAFFTLSLGRDAANQDILIGHYHYFAPRFNKYLTKTVIWLKYDHGSCPISINKNTGPGLDPNSFFASFIKDLNPADDRKEFNEIPSDIRLFLSNRALNRLTMPEGAISFLTGKRDSLEEWVKKKYEHVIQEDILRICCKEYIVCYYFGKELITQNTPTSDILKRTRVDSLSLSYDEYSGRFKATYLHQTPEKKSAYHGDVHRKDYSVEVMVSNNNPSNEHITQKNFIFLSFSIPQRMDDAFEKGFNQTPYFTGIISGLNDENAKPISFSVVMFTMTDKMRERSTEKIAGLLKSHLIPYFRKFSLHLCINPPPGPLI